MYLQPVLEYAEGETTRDRVAFIIISDRDGDTQLELQHLPNTRLIGMTIARHRLLYLHRRQIGKRNMCEVHCLHDGALCLRDSDHRFRILEEEELFHRRMFHTVKSDEISESAAYDCHAFCDGLLRIGDDKS